MRPRAPPQNPERFRIPLLPCGHIEEDRQAENTLFLTLSGKAALVPTFRRQERLADLRRDQVTKFHGHPAHWREYCTENVDTKAEGMWCVQSRKLNPNQDRAELASVHSRDCIAMMAAIVQQVAKLDACDGLPSCYTKYPSLKCFPK